MKNTKKDMASITDDKIFREILNAEGRIINDVLGVEVVGTTIISIKEKRIKYNNWNAILHAKEYCGQEKNACGIFLNDPAKKLSDCAHFMSHCLHAGGITINEPDPNNKLCKWGLAVRVADVIAGLKKLDSEYDNVTEIDFSDAIVGDYGFMKTPVRPSHAFMVCEPAPEKDDFKIYAHTTKRCCEKADPKWYQDFYTAFRITDA